MTEECGGQPKGSYGGAIRMVVFMARGTRGFSRMNIEIRRQRNLPALLLFPKAYMKHQISICNVSKSKPVSK
jgi:hypothetical protein